LIKERREGEERAFHHMQRVDQSEGPIHSAQRPRPRCLLISLYRAN